MADKYHMTVEQNVFYAKRNLVDSIWKEANIEGIGVTFPQTKEIFEGRVASGLSVDETVAINNLKHAWQFVLDTLEIPVDLTYVRQINAEVGAGIVFEAGTLRQFDVSIGGTNWRPPLPDYDTAADAIRQIATLASGQDRAIRMFCHLCRSQYFSDGNKRTAQLVANRMLIADGAGILAIPVEEKSQFEGLLVKYYETADDAALSAFLVERCLDGIRVS